METPDHGDAVAASRTTLEMMADLMEASFEALGEGVILASMPVYLERFGRSNARWMQERFGIAAPIGAGSSLAAMNLISEVTDTPFEMVDATSGHATKRLQSCEFAEAFEGRGDFPKAMICLLHQAAYQGSVNGLVPAADGFDVQVTSRILFGDPHCDFEVLARRGRDATEDLPTLPMAGPDGDEREWMAYGFYTFLLTSFIDFLTQHLPVGKVDQMLQACGRTVGMKVRGLLEASAMLPDDPQAAIETVLRLGGRVFKDGVVASCPQAEHIIELAPGPDGQRTRENACALCHHFVAGALGDRAEDLVRDGSLALGDDACGYRLRQP